MYPQISASISPDKIGLNNFPCSKSTRCHSPRRINIHILTSHVRRLPCQKDLYFQLVFENRGSGVQPTSDRYQHVQINRLLPSRLSHYKHTGLIIWIKGVTYWFATLMSPKWFELCCNLSIWNIDQWANAVVRIQQFSHRSSSKGQAIGPLQRTGHMQTLKWTFQVSPIDAYHWHVQLNQQDHR